jgi:hypothetical protein
MWDRLPLAEQTLRKLPGMCKHIRAFVVIVTVAITVAATITMIRTLSNRGLRDASYSNMRRLLVAIGNYQRLNGRLPYSIKGSEYALYDLKSTVPADAFADGLHSTASMVNWDNNELKISTSDYYYTNESSVKDHQLILASKQNREGTVLLGARDGTITAIQVNDPSLCPIIFLGNWLTPDDFIASSKASYDQWMETHGILEGPHSTASEHGLLRNAFAQSNGVTFTYIYKQATLARCSVEYKGRILVESVDVDLQGRIVGIRRSPVGWKESWLATMK